uniref:Hrs_helical domain-containing protein n=1 Tax=Echinostoma caproni TaxID=27848 RepID=A0A183ARE9_9TREM
LQTREAEELELALALSASEAECKERERRQNARPMETGHSGYPNVRSENGPMQLLPVLDTSDMDPELARYLNRHYWENRANALGQQNTSKMGQDTISPSPVPQPSAPRYSSPVPSSLPSSVAVLKNPAPGPIDGAERTGSKPSNANPAGMHLPGVPELTTEKQEEFLNALRASIEFFVNRMQSNSQRGRSIANDTTVQALFLTLHEMHPQLLQQKQAMEDRRGLQDKLTQLREAREALDALRQEHAARRQLEEQEAARLRQLQMMQKLEVMRQQKRDSLEYKRRMALEQTMQYQQQYQSQTHAMSHQIDPTTGLPLSVAMGQMHPPAYNMATPGYTSLAQMQPPYLPTTTTATTYGPSGVDPVTGGYGQPGVSISDGSNYYPTVQVPPITSHSQAHGQMYYGPQQVGPLPGQTHPGYNTAGPYSMQSLDAALPPSGNAQPDPRALYPGSQYLPTTQPQQPATQDPNVYTAQQVYAELPEPPNSEPRAASPSRSNYTHSQPAQRDAVEGQLISFD